MLSVVPWPTDGVGHLNLHYSMVNPRAGEPEQEPVIKGMGWLFQTILSFLERAAWMRTTNNFKDVWFCTSWQKEFTRHRK